MSIKQHDYLYVVVDRFSKMCILMSCKKTITTEKMLKFILNMYGLIMDFQILLLVTGILDSLVIFGPIFGRWWTQSWRRVLLFIRKMVAKPRCSTKPLCIYWEDILANILSCGMSNSITFNMLTTRQNTLLQIHHLLNYALGIVQNHHYTSSLVRMLQLMAIVILTRLESSLRKFRLYINKFKNNVISQI